jgi:hypothetical protein
MYTQQCLSAILNATMTQQSDRKRGPDLRSFHDLQASLPTTKMGAIVTLLPEIQSLQRQGHKTRAIWESLTDDGFQITYDLFRLYLSRARRKIAQFNGPTLTAPPKAGESRRPYMGNLSGEAERADTLDQHPIDDGLCLSRADPFAGIRRSRMVRARERFDYDPLTPLKEDLLR